MKVELVGVAKHDSLVLKNLPALVGQDSETDALSEELPHGNYRCMISQIDDHLEVWDLGTNGGTFVNGTRVTKTTLKASDRLSFGGTDFSVRYEHEPRRYLFGVRCWISMLAIVGRKLNAWDVRWMWIRRDFSSYTTNGLFSQKCDLKLCVVFTEEYYRKNLVLSGKVISMKLSARNVLKGTVKSITEGAVNTEVVVELSGDQEIVSIITKNSAQNLGLAKGKTVYSVIKASSVMLAVDWIK
jgi:molybdopterin-binding protein